MAENVALDTVDLAILRALQNDARISNKDLAAKVNVAASTCLERVRSLQRRGVLVGFHAEADPAALGRPLQAYIAVRVRPHNRDVVEPFIRFALDLPETLALSHIAGPDDFLVHVAVRDAAHLQRLILDGFTSRREVAHLQTQLIFDHVKKWDITVP
ncbi:AsnC family transcriptional regulator [Catellatospora sp. TT07R-123]|uniref:Lrp/AsnC family transcriptional regulator n=1 Tax=Catellatospora sp. TT07R-123 TaxID=2733863 RepID=UPI001B29919B|nr:Lrp/AsnC family transcriptional regulator [Catellatospora sp. TT07R-123]GHJ48592.1 AsnC family transcriptional regulator [Catellatospora sp. TT07R-123]